MKKLPQIPPNHHFDVPDEARYFDELSQRVRQKQLSKSKKAPQALIFKLLKPQFSLSFVAVMLVAAFIWWEQVAAHRQPVEETLKASLNQVSQQEIQNYLLEQNLSNEEIIDFIDEENIQLTATNPLKHLSDEELEELVADDELEDYL